MSDVEAAASLFDSERPTSDPFTMLGTSDSEHAADNSFPGFQYSSMISNTAVDIQSQGSYPILDSVELSRGHEPHDLSAVNGAGSLKHDTGKHYNEAHAAPPQSPLSTYLNAYNSRQPPLTNATRKETSLSMTSSYTVDHISQAYNPTLTCPAYYPAPTGHSSLNDASYNMQSMGSVGRDAVVPPVAPPSRSTPAASTLSRPKNAYDPPFLPAKPSKRPARPTEAQYTHNIYQISASSATYVSGNVSTRIPSSGRPIYEQYGESFPEIPLGLHSTSMQANDTSHIAYYAHNGSVQETSSAQGNEHHHSTPAMSFPPKRGIVSDPPERYSTPPGISFPSRSLTPRRVSVGSNLSQTKSEQSINPSPPSAPHSFSPSGPKFDSVSDMQSHQAMRPGPQCDAYSPQPPKVPAHSDYVPATTRNFIHRTASPLHNEYIPSGSSKAPTALNMNGTQYNAPSTTIPAASYSLSNTPTESVWTPGVLELPQEFGTKPSLGQYAPSPSLVGANDPLSRTTSRAPVVNFGFGGKIVTCFYGMPGLNAGFDIALSARTSSELKIRALQGMLPQPALNSPGPSFPGPLVSDPGVPSLSLVISGASSQAKTKKAGLLSYLVGRAEELNQGFGYLNPAQRRQAEHKLILMKLLRIMVENEGRLFGTPQSEKAVRAALVPRLESEPTMQDGVSLQVSYHPGILDEPPISVTSLRPEELSKIEEFLLQGDRRQAYRFALDRKLWAHAMIIASSIDREAWKEAVNEFLHRELAGGDGPTQNVSPTTAHSSQRSWESLRMAYSFFSGQGSAAVQELAPPTSLQTSMLSQPAIAAAVTPRTPNFMAMQPNIPSENLVKWAEAVAMMISPPFSPSSETCSAMVALGDQLLAQNWIEAAHACYLLSANNISSQPSIINGIGAPGVRITLLGSRNPGSVANDPDCLFLSEILEYALSLLPSAKGLGLPYLQAYRLTRAIWLAEIGDVQLASRYCEAIVASLSQTSPYSTLVLLEQLHGLQERLTGVFSAERSNSWIGGKISKPSLDSIGGWLEGRFTKLVTGDNETARPNDDHAKVPDQQFVGPFAHYSTISSTTPSSRSSPQPTTTLNVIHLPPTIGISSSYALATTERSSVTPAGRSSSCTESGINSYAHDADLARPSGSSETPVPSGAFSWWDSNGEAAQTPTAATFLAPEHNTVQANSDGFISLMNSQSFTFESKPSSQQASSPGAGSLDDNDLGLGNAKPKQIAAQVRNEGSAAKENTLATVKPQEKAVEATPPVAGVGGSWFGKWFRRSESSGPVKANLGEESTFYYDNDLKRWVDKKAGADAKAAQSPPPPPRAQTASPGMSASRAPPPPSMVGPPRASSVGAAGPPRPTSATDMGAERPTKAPPPRIRSNLAPSSAETILGPQLSPIGGHPPRPRSQATKRNVRSRYIDVFQQENGDTNMAP